jgi:ATP-dependent Clp protease ATP-binding subunit ClpC
MTSNLGTRGGKAALGIAAGDAGTRDRNAELARYRDAVTAAFRPEFVGRIDRVIAFHRLGAGEVAEVATLAIGKLAERRGFAQAGVALDVSPRAIAAIAEGGHSPEYGVRALRRHVEQHVIAPAARLLAAAGADAHGGALVVRTPDEADPYGAGARLGAIDDGALTIRLYRRSAAGGKRALRGALAVAELRRATDRDLARPLATAVRDQLEWLRAQLATAVMSAERKEQQAKRRKPKEALSPAQIQAMQVELARLDDAWTTCDALRGELRAAEELVLHALAAGEDADDLARAASALRDRFRAAYFWLLVARQDKRDAVALVAHGPDHAAGLVAWTRAILDVCERHGWSVSAHLRPQEQGGEPYRPGASWGPPRAPAALRERLEARPDDTRSILLRVRGPGAALLLGLERGLHRFVGFARVDPCHVTVETIASFVDFSDAVWASPLLQANRPTAPPKVTPSRTHVARGASTRLDDAHELGVPFAQYAARVEEIAAAQILLRLGKDPEADLADLWTFTSDGDAP